MNEIIPGGGVRMNFVSQAGSTVTVSGKYQGIFTISWDWFAEGACFDSKPNFNGDFINPEIVAACDCHEPMRVKLCRKP